MKNFVGGGRSYPDPGASVPEVTGPIKPVVLLREIVSGFVPSRNLKYGTCFAMVLLE
jgi:hypothetical protein